MHLMVKMVLILKKHKKKENHQGKVEQLFKGSNLFIMIERFFVLPFPLTIYIYIKWC
jgi:hypothetical protein